MVSKKRKGLYIITIAVLITFILISTYVIIHKFNSLNSDNKAVTTKKFTVSTYYDSRWTNKSVKIILKASSPNGLASNAYSYDGGRTWVSNNYVYINNNKTVKIVVKDRKNNKIYKNVNISNIDKEKPKKPSVTLSKWHANAGDYQPSPYRFNRSTPYKEGSWSNKYVTAFANGTGQTKSGFSHYIFSVRGASENTKDKKGAYRNIKADGVSYIKFKVCNNAGSCSDYSREYTIKIDKTINNIVRIAKKEIGNKGKKYYHDFYNLDADWCVMFVLWVTAHTPVQDHSNDCNKTNANGSNKCVYKKYLNIKTAAVWQYLEYISKNKNFYHSEYYADKYETYKFGNSAYTPVPGDLIFIDRKYIYKGDPKNCYDQIPHMGIVEEVKNGIVYTIEGNTNNTNFRYSEISRKHYNLNDSVIVGYGNWNQ